MNLGRLSINQPILAMVLSIVLLIVGAVSHGRPDMTLAFKAAIPVAILATISGFTITLVRGIRAATAPHRR